MLMGMFIRRTRERNALGIKGDCFLGGVDNWGLGYIYIYIYIYIITQGRSAQMRRMIGRWFGDRRPHLVDTMSGIRNGPHGIFFFLSSFSFLKGAVLKCIDRLLGGGVG